MTPTALSIQHLEVTFYESSFKLSDINFEIESGTISGLIGRNGSGKTTLLNAIIGLQKYKKGTITYFETDKSIQHPDVKKRIGFVSTTLPFDIRFSADQIVGAMSPFYQNYNHSLYHKYMNIFKLNEDIRISKYSTGMQKKFQILLMVCCNPNLLILDEPTANLDSVSKDDIIEMLMDYMQDESNSILFSTNHESDVERIGDYVTFMEHGNVLFTEEKNTLLEQYQLFHCPKESLTNEFRQHAVGIRETSFGYEGLIAIKNIIPGTDIQFTRAGFDEFMRYFSKEDLQ